MFLSNVAGDGHVVVGSDDGKVRLFSSATLTMAKTSIPGLGAPITAVDVSHDSKWCAYGSFIEQSCENRP